MIFKISTIRSLDDPHERVRRLARLYQRFENTPADLAILAESEVGGPK